MGNWSQNQEAESADCIPVEFVPAREPIATGTIGTSEYRDAVACLHGIIELSPRTAHQLMRRIIGIYRDLATIADRDLE